MVIRQGRNSHGIDAKELQQRFFTLAGDELIDQANKGIVPVGMLEPGGHQAAAKDDAYFRKIPADQADHREGA